jgi:hypothetical protein
MRKISFRIVSAMLRQSFPPEINWRLIPALLGVLLLWPLVGKASILARESFERDGTGALSGQGGGIGWAGNWSAPGNVVRADVVNTTGGTMTYTIPGGQTINGANRALEVQLSGAAQSQLCGARALDTPIAQTFYVGYLVRYQAGASWGGSANTFTLHLGTNSSSTTTINFGLRADANNFIVRYGTGSGSTTGGALTPGADYYLVLKVNYAAGAFSSANLWLNPTAGEETTTPNGDATLTGFSFPNPISHIFWREAVLDTDDVLRVDELRIGTSFNDVVPSSSLSVTLTNPVNGTIFITPANLLLQATASTTNGTVANVTFYAGATKLADVPSAPYSFNWTGAPAGNYALTAVAKDSIGGMLTSAIINVTVTNPPPSISLTNPANGAGFEWPANTILQATASDSNGSVTNVAFYAGNNKLADIANEPYSFSWSAMPPGAYSLQAVATDNEGGSTTSSVVNITITNSLVVAMTNPADGTVFAIPADILLGATASDSRGTVTNVSFYAGTTKLADVTSAPYSWTWITTPVGNYALMAVAASDQGDFTTSSIVSITVVDTNALVQVQKWHPVDLQFISTNAYINPFTNVALSASFSGPGGISLTVPGFYAGSQTWIVRFCPTFEGIWSYTTTSSDSMLNSQIGGINCVSNLNPAVHGVLRVDPNYRHNFIYDDGTPCFYLSFEADWLGEMDFGNPNVPRAKSLIDIYRTNGFNAALINLYAYDTSWESGTTSAFDFGPPTQIVWLGSNGSPDYFHMNTNYFNNYDRVIDYLFQNGITAHIMMRVYNKQVNWPANRSAGDNLYWSYIVARYQGYPNIIWNFSKEAYNESDDVYENDTLLGIRARDAYAHMLTIHDDTTFYSNPAYTNTCDFRTYQSSGGYSAMITGRNAQNWPILQAEDQQYQVGNDGGYTFGPHSTVASTLNITLENFMAGAAVNYYYTYHSWDVVRYNEMPNGLSAYKNLADLFRSTAWRTLVPSENLINSPGSGRHCLANPGSEYVVYLQGSGSVTLTISGAPAGNSLKATWLNVTTGAQQNLANTGNGSPTFTNPWSDPALLHLSPVQPTLASVVSCGLPQLQWSAANFVLEHAPQITGPWSSVAPQPASPYNLSATNSQEFFRLRWPGP